MLILNEIFTTLLDKKMFYRFKKKMKIGYFLFVLNSNYKITGHYAGN